jgi:hypothetical protein
VVSDLHLDHLLSLGLSTPWLSQTGLVLKIEIFLKREILNFKKIFQNNRL